MAQILIIDDSAFSRMTLRHVLEDANHQVEEAPGVSEALLQLEAGRPDLIVSDYLMADQTGADLLRELNKRGETVPVIVLTADLQAGTADECRSEGAIAVLHKPVNPDELLTTIDARLNPGT